MESVTRRLLFAASLLTVGLSVMAGAAAGYALGTRLVLFGSWTFGGHNIGALFLAAAGFAFAVLKFSLAIHWAEEPLSRHRAVFAFVLWTVSLLYVSTTVVFFNISPFVHLDAPAPSLVLAAGLWFAIEIAAGLLPAIAWPVGEVSELSSRGHTSRPTGGRVARRVMPLAFPLRTLRPLPEVPVLLDHQTDHDLLGLLQQLATVAGELGVQMKSDGCIVTTQRWLAARAGIALSQANKELHTLQRAGAIELTTSGRKTVIRIRSCSRRSRTVSGRERSTT
jgi:hypothetical protein